MLHRFQCLAVAALCIPALGASTWNVAKTRHFEVYSQAGGDSARSALVWFEELRLFFQRQTGLNLDNRPPVRVIGFRSAAEYDPYRLHAASDAYFAGTESRDFIVMSSLGPDQFATAAHEYAHVVLHAAGLRPPQWLEEGLAEFFSTVHLGEAGSNLGGDRPAQTHVLRTQPWLPLSRLLSISPEDRQTETREQASLFYAQSWALTEMLFLSPDYGPQFPALMTALTLGSTSQEAIAKVYGRPLDTVARDLHAWTSKRVFPSVRLPGVVIGAVDPEMAALSGFEARLLLAELLHASGDLNRAEAAYRDLVHEAPERPELAAALGTIALRKGDNEGARREWKRAIELGIADATLCFQYAALAGMAGLPAAEIRPALERAVKLRPGYDDALYSLALLEKNAGNYAAAVTDFRAMQNVPPFRAYNYWTALADALNELDRREEAKAAAQQAAVHAGTPAERERARQLEFISQTDLAVQFAHDASGRVEMVTTRIPHDAAGFNPFVEPGDRMQRIDGTLREILCGGPATRIVVESVRGRVTLEIADPSRVQMRNAPPEFTCGPQKPAGSVTVDYAATQGAKIDGVVRGIAFK